MQHSSRKSVGEEVFLSKASQRRLLRRSEVVRLIKKARAGDLRARNKIIEHNMLLVVKYAEEFGRRKFLQHLSMDDLIQEGTLGLMRAVEKFDPDVGTEFSTYATWWIKQRIMRAMQDKDRTIRIPVHRMDAGNRAHWVRKELEDRLSREPTDEEVLDEFKVLYPKLVAYKGKAAIEPLPAHTDSLERQFISHGGSGEDGNSSLTLLDKLFEADDDPSTEYSQEELKEDVMRLLSAVEERDQDVLRMRFGLDPYGCAHTLEQIGDKHHLSRERVRQIVVSATEVLAAFADPSEFNLGKLGDRHQRVDTERLRELMAERGMNQKTLSNRSGIVSTAITSLLRERTNPRPHTLDAVAQALGVDRDEFMVRELGGGSTEE